MTRRTPLDVGIPTLAQAVAESASWRGSAACSARPRAQVCESVSFGRCANNRGSTINTSPTGGSGRTLTLSRQSEAAAHGPSFWLILGIERGPGRHGRRCGATSADSAWTLIHSAHRPLSHRTPGTQRIDVRNLRDAGAMVVAAVLTLCGHRVSWPLEPAPYDLIVTTDSGIERVQVKTTTRRQGNTWVCSLSRSRYTSRSTSLRRRSWYTSDEIDSFGVVDGDLAVYRLPFSVVAGRSAIHLSRYSDYRVGFLPTVSV